MVYIIPTPRRFGLMSSGTLVVAAVCLLKIRVLRVVRCFGWVVKGSGGETDDHFGAIA
jgi:hypothetical protein